MRFKRLLALLLAAALALAVLVGCGSGQQSAARVLLNLLDGKYPNISIEIDPDLEADLRQAVNEGETDAEIRAALEKLLGSGVSFRLIGDGQKGDSAWNLILYPGSDPDKAAQAAYSQWNIVFANVPDDGKYGTGLAMVETENGIWMLVKATVDKAARRNDDDDDEPEEPEDLGYTVDGEGNYTVTTAEGLKTVADIANNGNLGINITLTENINLTDMDWTPIGTNFRNSYTGTFDGGGHTISELTVTTSDQYAGLFGYIGDGGTVKNVKLENVQITSDHQYANVGGVAGWSYGNIENCSVSGSVGNSNSGGTYNSVGGVVGQQWSGSITGCSSSATVKGTGSVGGIAGETNRGASLTGCYTTGDVTLESNNPNSTYAGGVVGSNGSSTLTACYATGRVTGSGSGSGSGTIYVGGVTGTNDFGTLTACYHANGTVSGPDGTTGGVVGRNYKDTSIVTACYWSGYNGDGIGYDETGNYSNENANEYNKYFGSHNNKVTTAEIWNALVTAMAEYGYSLGGSWDAPYFE